MFSISISVALLHNSASQPFFCIWPQMITPDVLSCNPPGKESLCMPDLSCPDMKQSVLYDPISGLCNIRPSDGIAVHIVMLAPLWPGTSTIALFPITFLPCQPVLANLIPASMTLK